MLSLERSMDGRSCQYRSYPSDKIVTHRYGMGSGSKFEPQHRIVLYRFDYRYGAESRYGEFHGGYGYLYMSNSSRTAREPVWGVARPVFVEDGSGKTWDFYVPNLGEFEILRSGSSLYAFSSEEDCDRDRFLGLVEDYLSEMVDEVSVEFRVKLNRITGVLDDARRIRARSK